MIHGRTRQVVEDSIAAVANRYPQGFTIDWLRTEIYHRGVGHAPPTSHELGHFISVHRQAFGLVRVSEGRWARAAEA
jgi:hypothetical protein